MREQTMMMCKRILTVVAALSLLAAGTGCGGIGSDDVGAETNEAENDDFGPGSDTGVPDENASANFENGANAGENQNQDPGQLPPETAEDYDFSEPAIIGSNVYVANETLNSVAIIDSDNLSISTVLTGVRPTEVVGPGSEGAVEGARAMALNEGSSTVTMIDPDDHSTSNIRVLSDSNRIAMAPGGRHAVVWYDPDEDDSGQLAGDLSAVSVVSAEGSFEIAVGFRVRDVQFDEAGERALLVTHDGVSVLELNEIDSDGFAQPRPVIPEAYGDEHIRDLDVEVTPDGRYVIAHRFDGNFFLVTDLEEEETYAVELPAAPTGVALRDDDGQTEVIAVLRAQGAVLRAAVPEGFQQVAEAQEAAAAEEEENEEEENEEEENEEEENGEEENGEEENEEENGEEENGEEENGGEENGEEENGEEENGEEENGGEENGGEEDGGEEDGGEEEADFSEFDDFSLIELPFFGPGSVALSADGEQAFLFTTVGDETRAALLDIDDETTSVVAFQKTIKGALADERGDTFLVFHDREEGSREGLTPADEEYVARSWGFTLFDVSTGTTRLILTDLEVEQATLWSPATGSALAYMRYAAPEHVGAEKLAHRDVLRVDLSTFSKEVFRLSSLPDGIGVIPQAERVFVNQVHPQGRMTFVDVHTSERQTVTGYQLNAGID